MLLISCQLITVFQLDKLDLTAVHPDGAIRLLKNILFIDFSTEECS